MKEKLLKLTKNNYIIDYWKEQVKFLEKKDIELHIVDFDYTIFSRDEQLEKEEYLRKNRWDLWPKAIIENDWIHKFLEKYYNNTNFPTTILDKLNKKYDLIITAGVYEYQVSKLIACKLDDYNYIITESAKDKILEIIRYIIYKLKFIPSSINIYEDRPEYFKEYKDLIEDILGTKLNIYYVEMDWNRGYKKNRVAKIIFSL